MSAETFTAEEVEAMPRVDPKRASSPLPEPEKRAVVIDRNGKKWGVCWQDGRYVKYPR